MIFPPCRNDKSYKQGAICMSYKLIDRESYYRRGVFRHFTEDCKCSVSMTARLDVTELAAYSRRSGTKFYLNFLYLLSRVLNSREDYRMGYLWQTDELIAYDAIHPTQYVFHEDTETFTLAYSTYHSDYAAFYATPRPSRSFIPRTTVTMRRFTPGRCAISSGRRRRANTALMRSIIPTGSTPRASRGFRTIRSSSSCRTAICISRPLSTGAAGVRKTGGS